MTNQETETEDGWFSFAGLLDIINPLQHIPIVSTLYREITGDEITPLSRVAGGALFGGLAGLVSAGVNAVVDYVTGRDLGEHTLALVMGGDDDTGGAETGPVAATGTPGLDAPGVGERGPPENGNGEGIGGDALAALTEEMAAMQAARLQEAVRAYGNAAQGTGQRARDPEHGAEGGGGTGLHLIL